MKVEFAVNAPVDQALEERGRKLFAGRVDFVKGVVAMDGCRPPTGRRSASPGGPTWASPRSSTR